MSFQTTPYLDAPVVVAQALQALSVPRTGLPLASSQPGLSAFTYFTQQLPSELELVTHLPAVHVDLNSAVHIDFTYANTSVKQLIPVQVLFFVPLIVADGALSAAEVQANAAAADLDIKTVFGDAIAVLASGQVEHALGKRIQLLPSPGIETDAIAFESQTKIRVRAAELWVQVIGPVA